MAEATVEKKTLVDFRHPVYEAECPLWTKWRLCYEGSDAFKEAFLYQYSKREDPGDFRNRSRITYVPGHAKSVINIIRNALAVRLPDVVRKGSPEYLEAMQSDADGFDNSMNTFVALQIVPMLLVQGKRYVVVDAPVASAGETRAEDSGSPFFFTVDAEDVLSWTYGDDGEIVAILMKTYEDVKDPETNLVVGTSEGYRYMAWLENKETYTAPCGADFTGPGVVVAHLDEKGEVTNKGCQLLEIERVPVVEFSLVASLMAEIADHQISMLNLASTDMDFLWRGNFPLYTQQQKAKTAAIRPRGTKRRRADEDTDSEDALSGGDPGTGRSTTQRVVGTGHGIGYPEGTERPGFVSPATENLKASMEKQSSIAKEIRVLVDLALVSLSVKAVEQSGKSKAADRIGEEAGLAYIGNALESGERALGEIFEMLAGNNPDDIEVTYPENYSIRTSEDRRKEADELRGLHSAVRSETYQHILDKRIAEVLLKPLVSSEELEEVLAEIEASAFIDDDKDRASVIQKDVTARIVSRETAGDLRGYGDDEQAKVRGESAADVSALLGGDEGAPSAGGTEDDEGGEV
jgi:hypothetical protein